MEKLAIPVSSREKMLDHIHRCLPEEACGLLAGRGDRVDEALPVANQLHSPTRFYMDPVELVIALHWMDDHNLDILGIYHSHPTGPNHPSETDLKEYLYPSAAAIIWSFSGDGWNVKAYLIDAKIANEIPITWLIQP